MPAYWAKSSVPDPVAGEYVAGTKSYVTRPLTVIGVVGDIRIQRLAADPRPAFYWSFHRFTYGPMRLVVVAGRTYLEGWCRSADDVRLFRVDRIEAAAAAKFEKSQDIYTARAREIYDASRARYAQGALKPDEVIPEWRKMRALNGGPDEVSRFTGRALNRVGAPLEKVSDHRLVHLAALATRAAVL